jgi:5-methylcytosine-specific restriction endonuclease McrA
MPAGDNRSTALVVRLHRSFLLAQRANTSSCFFRLLTGTRGHNAPSIWRWRLPLLLANQEKVKARSAERYAANREEEKVKRREYARSHTVDAYQRNKAWREENLERSSGYKRKRLESDPEERHRQNASNRKWAHANRSTTRRASMRRETRLRSAYFGRFTDAERDELLRRCGHMCLCCRRHESEVPDGKLQADHVVPLCRLAEVPFGPLTKHMAELNMIGNIQPLCRTCNQKKGTTDCDYRDSRSERSFVGPVPRRSRKGRS